MTLAALGAFIFDMDGTLVDNMPVHTQVWIELLAQQGVSLTADEFHRQASGKTNRQILRQMLGDDLSDAAIVEFAERKEALYRARYRPHLKPLAGLVNFLEQAQRLAISMAVVTSAERPNVQFVLGGLNITSYFEVVMGSEQVQHSKPHPEGFMLAAQKLGVAPQDCLVFEDSLAGVQAAHRAGMRAVALATTVAPELFADSPAVIRVVEDFGAPSPGAILG